MKKQLLISPYKALLKERGKESMNKNWYKLECTHFEYVTNKIIKDLEKIIDKLFDDPRFWNDVMVFSPRNINKLKIVWIFPPKTVNLGIEKALKMCGAKTIPQPDINDVSVHFGDESNIDYFFSDK